MIHSASPMATPPIALVTGAGRSIGRAIVHRLHADGYRVAVTDKDAAVAQQVASERCASGETARAWSLDVSQPGQIEQVFNEINQYWGVVHNLINNAGVYPNKPALELTENEWDAVLDSNLKGAFFCSQVFARQAADNPGTASIVNIASTSAFSARPGAAAYAASKAGMVMLTKSLAQEWAEQGIRVNAVAPGLIEVREGMVSDAYKAHFVQQVPSRRIGNVDDIAAAVCYLLAPEADYVNGHCLVVDGGFLAGRDLIRSAGNP